MFNIYKKITKKYLTKLLNKKHEEYVKVFHKQFENKGYCLIKDELDCDIMVLLHALEMIEDEKELTL